MIVDVENRDCCPERQQAESGVLETHDYSDSEDAVVVRSIADSCLLVEGHGDIDDAVQDFAVFETFEEMDTGQCSRLMMASVCRATAPTAQNAVHLVKRPHLVEEPVMEVAEVVASGGLHDRCLAMRMARPYLDHSLESHAEPASLAKYYDSLDSCSEEPVLESPEPLVWKLSCLRRHC